MCAGNVRFGNDLPLARAAVAIGGLMRFDGLAKIF